VEAGLVHDAEDVATEYVDPRRDVWTLEMLPALRARSTLAVARSLGVDVSTVKRWKTGSMRPHSGQLTALREWLRADRTAPTAEGPA
jgi:hypothetical protein